MEVVLLSSDVAHVNPMGSIVMDGLISQTRKTYAYVGVSGAATLLVRNTKTSPTACGRGC